MAVIYGPNVFTPRVLAPALWLDASDTSTLFDVSGNVVAPDGAIARWEDKSNNLRHVTQLDSGSRPLRKTSVQNGRDVVRFDGVNDFLTTSQILTSQPFTAFAVVQTTKNTSNILGASSTSSGTRSIAACARRSTGTHILFAGSVVVGGTFPSTWVLRSDTVNGASSSIFSNASSVATGNSGTRFDIRSIGSNFNEGGVTDYFGGDAAEILIFPTALSDANRQAVETYLNAKWAIYSTYDSDAVDYFARIVAAGSSISTANQAAVNTFIVGCKADGIWNAIKASCILAGADTLAGALVPLVGAIPTNFNFLEADYSRTTGLKGDGSTKWLRSNRANNLDPQNSRHIYALVTTPTTISSTMTIGTIFQNGGSYVLSGPTTTAFRSTGTNISIVRTQIEGGYAAARSADDSANLIRMFAGSLDTILNTSAVPTSSMIGVFAAGSGINITNARISFYSIGEYLNLALLNTRLATLMSSLI